MREMEEEETCLMIIYLPTFLPCLLNEEEMELSAVSEEETD